MKPNEYHKTIEDIVNKEYSIASSAKKNGFDPSPEPEIYIAKDLGDKVEGLIEFKGIGDIIRKLQKEVNSEEEVAFKLVDELIKRVNDREKAADLAVRAALAFLTQGSVAAPLEGIADIKILKNPDNSEYLAVYYAGPIRAAGGTAEAISVVVADYVHRALKLDRYKPNQKEIERYTEEIRWYHRRKRLQYNPKEDEITTIVKNVPVCIDGDPTEPYEVSTNRNLGRVKTNRVRGGMCLVIAEGIAQKAPKLLKRLKPIQEKYGLDWSWLEGLLVKRKTDESPKEKEKLSNIFEKELPDEFKKEYEDHLFSIDEITELVQETSAIDVLEDYTEEEPEKKGSDKFLNEVPAGRPVFSFPGRIGGFNLRYGRTRGSGYAALCLNPATMHLLDDFVAIGTQIRLEMPGKAGIVTPCDTINGPTILLKDGEVLQVNTYQDAEKYKGRVKRIINPGDILISAGDFFENNHKLLPPVYCEEWWAKEVKKAQKEKKATTKDILNSSKFLNRPFEIPDFNQAKKLSKDLDVPLHPAYTFQWNYIRNSDLMELAENLSKAEITEEKIILKNKPFLKKIIEKLCIFHKIENSKIVIREHKEPLLFSLGRPKEWEEIIKIIKENKRHKPLRTINKLSEAKIKEKAPTRIGARMGRPEKAKPRKMNPAPHVLFPTGVRKSRVRNFIKLYKEEKKIDPILAKFKCDSCSSFQFYPKCTNCGEKTSLLNFCPNCRIFSTETECKKCGSINVTFERQEIDIKPLLDNASKKLGKELPKNLKGVLGMATKNRIPEAMEKGILRAEQDIYVFKDGTIRHDSTDAPLTHFRPNEINTSIEKLKELGYDKDIYGENLEKEDQILELKPQDIIISDYGESSATEYLFKAGKFVDNLLELYYGIEKYYNFNKKEDLAGTLVIALAPHTSTGIIGRIIGSTSAKVTFAHPCFHDAKRRDCFSGEETFPIFDGSEWNIVEMGPFIDDLLKNNIYETDALGNKILNTNGYKTISFNKKTSRYELKPITAFSKHVPQNHLLKLKTKSGRQITTTGLHPFPYSDKNALVKKPAFNLEKAMLPTKINVPEKDISKLDLLDLKEKNLMVRYTDDFFKKIVEKNGGLKKTAEKLKINKKTLSNYIYRKSVPYTILKQLNCSVPKNVSVSIKRDTISIPRFISVNKNFLRLVGFYLAEGYSRKKEGLNYQVAFCNKKHKRQVTNLIKTIFNIVPSDQGEEDVICSKLIYSLFTTLLKCGSKAKEKRIPPVFLSLPLRKVKYLLQGYFEGDGSVFNGSTPEVNCTSVSKLLLKDIEFLLNRCGIVASWYHDKRPAKSRLVADFNKRKNRIFINNSYKLRLYSTSVKEFYEKIGFWSGKKNKKLERIINNANLKGKRIKKNGMAYQDSIVKSQIILNEAPLYNLTVADNHNLIVSGISAFQCDGDEDAIMLLLDALLNFSKSFLPQKRGGKMDAPLVITSKLGALEIDDEVYDIDIVNEYPLSFYESVEKTADPNDINILTFGDTIYGEDPFSGWSYTHETTNINDAPLSNIYTEGEMVEKLKKQMHLAEIIDAVDEKIVAEKIINSHFLPDIKGNLRTFSRQKVRCTKCNSKYRRPPLSGKCTNCGGNLTFTVHRGSIEKYLQISKDLIKKYNVSPYLSQQIDLYESNIKSIFGEKAQKELQSFS